MSMINSSIPRMTANVTMAPITPATAFEIPPPLEEVLDEDPDEDPEDPLPLELPLPEDASKLGAQTPVLLPQALHQSA